MANIENQQSQTAAQTRDQIREQVRQQVQDAQAQVREAQRAIEAVQAERAEAAVDRVRAPTAPLPPLPPMGQGPGENVIVVPSGFNSPDDIPPRAQEVVMMFFAVMAVIVIGLPIARAISRWIDRRANAPAVRTADVEPHLIRIEQAVEAMAIEIERVSEAQRYLTKLQTGARADPLLVPRNHGD